MTFLARTVSSAFTTLTGSTSRQPIWLAIGALIAEPKPLAVSPLDFPLSSTNSESRQKPLLDAE